MADPFANLASPVASGSSCSFKARVLFNYTSQASNQINLIAGQEITILTKGEAGGWTQGVNSGGRLPSDLLYLCTPI